MTKLTSTKPSTTASLRLLEPGSGAMDKAALKDHVLLDLAHSWVDKYGDLEWSSVRTTGFYLKGPDVVFKVMIEDSESLLEAGLVAVDSALKDEEDTPLGRREKANCALFVVPEDGKSAVYRWSLDLLAHICQDLATYYRAGSESEPTHRALSLKILKLCAENSFTFESESYTRLLGSGVEEAHA